MCDFALIQDRSLKIINMKNTILGKIFGTLISLDNKLFSPHHPRQISGFNITWNYTISEHKCQSPGMV